MRTIILNEEVKTTSAEGMRTLLKFYNNEEIKERLSNPDNVFYKLVFNKIIIGFAELDNNHLVSLFIERNFRNKGIGKTYIQYITNNLLINSEITVFASLTSIEFYLKNGFVQQSLNCKENYGILYMPMVLKNEYSK